jgi:hypothetical protein
MFKVGPARTKQGAEAYVSEITESKIIGRYCVGDTWIPGAWLSGGFFLGPDIPSSRDLQPNADYFASKKLLAYVSDSGIVRFALEGSMEANYYDKHTVGMRRAPKFDIQEKDT